MDPPEVISLPHQRRQRRRGPLHLQLILLFTVGFVILSLLKLEPLARNSVQDHNSKIDAPHNKDVNLTLLRHQGKREQALRLPSPLPNHNNKNIDKRKAVPKDGLMVLAFFYEKILFGRETVNLTAAGFSQYADEGSVLHEGKNMTMFEAVRALRHNVNPNFDVREDGIWSNMEWDNLLHYNILKNMSPQLPAIQTPLKFSEGGLGWYDNLDFDVRQRQGNLASKYGVDGFIFYTTAKQKSVAMTREVVDARVRDGEPSGRFAIMVVDDCRYKCTESEILGTESLIAFGKWLANITAHSDYIRVNGLPVVYIYKLGSFLASGDNVANPESIRRAFSIVEKASGAPVYWVGTNTFHCLRGIPKAEKGALYKELDAWIDFAPHRGNCMSDEPPSAPPQIDKFHETFLSGWYPAPRGLTWFASKHSAGWSGTAYRDQSTCEQKNDPARFYAIMKKGFARARCREEDSHSDILDNGQFWKPLSIFAWNEWGEQAVLEPSTLNGFSYLESLHQARHDAALLNCSSWRIPETNNAST